MEEKRDHLPNWLEKIDKKERLTNDLIGAWIITVQSVLDLSRDLIENCGYQYVLTRRLNQDPLEVCTTRTKSIQSNFQPIFIELFRYYARKMRCQHQSHTVKLQRHLSKSVVPPHPEISERWQLFPRKRLRRSSVTVNLDKRHRKSDLRRRCLGGEAPRMFEITPTCFSTVNLTDPIIKEHVYYQAGLALVNAPSYLRCTACLGKLMLRKNEEKPVEARYVSQKETANMCYASEGAVSFFYNIEAMIRDAVSKLPSDLGGPVVNIISAKKAVCRSIQLEALVDLYTALASCGSDDSCIMMLHGFLIKSGKKFLRIRFNQIYRSAQLVLTDQRRKDAVAKYKAKKACSK